MPARILVVDDNAALARNLRDVLEGAEELDVEVVMATDGAHALEAARVDGLDVAVVDVQLPDGSGVDLVGPLRAAAPGSEIVLLTGSATVDHAIAALRAGAFAFVLKSFRPDELISTVARALEKIALKRERRVLERRAADAEALNAMAPLALGLAHEIRNPLNAAVLELHLLGRSIERLSDAETRDPMRRRVKIVGDEIGRLNRLLTDFLELARPRAPQREPVDLARVVADVLDLETEAIAGRGIEARRDLHPGCITLGDVEKLKQVVLNLVVNALDAMPEGGALSARVSGTPDEVHLELTDTGPGIDRAVLAEIFDPFFTTKPAGTGLGLAIVHKLVDQHGGRVTVDTRPSAGTTITVRLPRAPEPPSTG